MKTDRLKGATAVLIAVVLLFLLGGAAPGFDNAATPSRPVQWKWRKSFTGARLDNLAMSWNGSVIAFSIREDVPANGDVIVVLDGEGKPLKDWRLDKKIKRISLDGEGNKMLVELEDCELLLYSDWRGKERPAQIKGSMCGAVLSPKGSYISIKDPAGISVLSSVGKSAWSVPCGRDCAIYFPFIHRENHLLRYSDGAISLIRDGKTSWEFKINKPVSAASSFLENDVVAVATGRELLIFSGGNPVRIAFQGSQGVSCSGSGETCAAMGATEDGRRLSIYDAKGRESWRYFLKEASKGNALLHVSSKGDIVIGGFKEKRKWSLRFWDSIGSPLWIANVEGGIRDFKASWSGKKIAVLTEDERIVFYELKDSTPVK